MLIVCVLLVLCRCSGLNVLSDVNGICMVVVGRLVVGVLVVVGVVMGFVVGVILVVVV